MFFFVRFLTEYLSCKRLILGIWLSFAMKHRAFLLFLVSVTLVITRAAWGLYWPQATLLAPGKVTFSDVPPKHGDFNSRHPLGSLLRWDEIESPDYLTYMANLRSVGCPEETIRDIVLCDINKLYDTRKNSEGSLPSGDYWKSHHWNTEVERDRQKKWRQLEEE
ncbi:MAG: hypothetical protein JWN25_2027, partial [Verrucomicrobiales bacterium]|nr:hypothetical protein [Verrucomicrobiales bacterium]